MTATDYPLTANLRTRVFDVLESKGITQRWFARQIGMSDTMVTHIKAGRRPINERFVAGAVRVLGLPFDVLFYALPSPSRDELLAEPDAIDLTGDEPNGEGAAA